MRYLVFVNNSVQGPFTIKEIVEKNLISRDLLVCPNELSATKPSSWYFARELSEFDPYLSNQKSSIMVEDFNYDNIIIPVDESEGKLQSEFIDDFDLDDIIEKEKKELLDKEKDDYKKKIQSFERNIKELDEKLKKAFSVIEKYEKSLKDKEKIIEKLENEIVELKRSKEEIIKNLKNEKKEDDSSDLGKKLDIQVKMDKTNTFNDVDNTNSLTQIEKDVKTEILPVETLSTNFNISAEDSNIFFDKQEKSILDSKIELDGGLENDESGNLEIPIISLKKDSNTYNDSVSLQYSQEVKEEVVAYNKQEVEPNQKKEDEKLLNKVSSLNEEEVKQTNESDVLNNIEIPQAFFISSSPIENSSLFQAADINLETVESKLDIVDSSKIEPVPSKIETQELKNDVLSETTITSDREQIESFKPYLDEGKKLSDFKVERGYDSLASENVSIKEKDSFNDVKSDQQDVLEENIIKNEDVKNIKRGGFSQEETIESKSVVSARKRRSSRLIIITGVGAILFFFALVYILKTGSDQIGITSDNSKKSYQISSSQMQNIQTPQQIPSQTQNIEETEDMKISKINENIKNAIEIVKTYNLGEGRGNIERWLSNTVASSVKGKEEWNATYLSKNIFVVQYRFLRFKAEPVVYLFEVDVEKKQIIRGINNNAINLLAGNKSVKGRAYSSISKKLDEQLESDEEMF